MHALSIGGGYGTSCHFTSVNQVRSTVGTCYWKINCYCCRWGDAVSKKKRNRKPTQRNR